MKGKKLLLSLAIGASLVAMTACGGFINPGDNLGGAGTADAPAATQSENAEKAKAAVGTAAAGETEIPEDAAPITEAGEYAGGTYYVEGPLDLGEGTLEFTKKTTLYLKNAAITSSGGKVIASDKKLTITLIGSNSIETTEEETNAVTCDKDLTFNGAGSLSVASTKNAVKGTTITVTEATLSIAASGDGLHAEIDDYDKKSQTEAPEFNYEDGGWVFIDGGSVTIDAGDDGIQSDTFVYIKSGTVNIKTNGGAPAIASETSSKNASGKGIKAGTIDWGKGDITGELEEGDYLILIEGGEIDINSNDDAIHSNYEVVLAGGTVNIATGDDGIHADERLEAAGGTVNITKCYEGMEAAKVEISGGTYSIVSADDGINAADGTDNPPFQANPNCHMIISGGEVRVNAQGDGLDSNGTMLISGGYVYVTGSTSGGDAALDSDGGILIDGGYVFAVGSLGMVETPATNSKQNVVSFARSAAISADTNISLTDADGNVLFYYTPTKSCQSVIISCPELETGESYAIYGGSSKLCSFKISSRITEVGSSGGIQSPGGMPGGGNGGRPGGKW